MKQVKHDLTDIDILEKHFTENRRNLLNQFHALNQPQTREFQDEFTYNA